MIKNEMNKAMSTLANSLTYQEYIENFNLAVTHVKYTPRGTIAKAEGVWYWVNGVSGDITDVRHRLNDTELQKLGLRLGDQLNTLR